MKVVPETPQEDKDIRSLGDGVPTPIKKKMESKRRTQVLKVIKKSFFLNKNRYLQKCLELTTEFLQVQDLEKFINFVMIVLFLAIITSFENYVIFYDQLE